MEIRSTTRCAWSTDADSGATRPAAATPPADTASPVAATTDTATVSWGARAAALFAALDADQNGAVTEDEFKDGAKALLRRGRSEDHAHRSEHSHRGGRRLEHRLERLFDRVDADGDGALTKDELSSALSHATPTAPPPPADPPASTGTAASTSTFVSVTFVAVAVRSYTAVSQLAAPSPAGVTVAPSPATPTTPTT